MREIAEGTRKPAAGLGIAGQSPFRGACAGHPEICLCVEHGFAVVYGTPKRGQKGTCRPFGESLPKVRRTLHHPRSRGATLGISPSDGSVFLGWRRNVPLPLSFRLRPRPVPGFRGIVPQTPRASRPNRLRLVGDFPGDRGELAAVFHIARRARFRDPPCLAFKPSVSRLEIRRVSWTTRLRRGIPSGSRGGRVGTFRFLAPVRRGLVQGGSVAHLAVGGHKALPLGLPWGTGALRRVVGKLWYTITHFSRISRSSDHG